MTKKSETPKSETKKVNPRLAKPKFRSATVAILGRPNAGKSTLLNSLLDVAVSPVSDRPQTTRANVKGILQIRNQDEWQGQLVLVDTPGVNFRKGLLERSMHAAVENALEDVDVAIWTADARSFDKDLSDIAMKRPGADKIAGWLKSQLDGDEGIRTKWVLVLTKADLLQKNELLPVMERAAKLFPNLEHIVPVASPKGISDPKSNLGALLNVLEGLAGEGEALYPEDAWTDQNESQLIQNLVREAIFRRHRKEVPYETDCTVTRFLDPEPPLRKKPQAEVTIWVSRQSLKPILVGHGGSRIKDIGIGARERYREITGEDIVLKLFVKVMEKWNLEGSRLEELGYTTH